MRVFIGVGFKNHVLDYLESVKDYLKPSIYEGVFVPYDNAHITLKYIGDVSTKELDDLCNIIDDLPDHHNKFDIKIGNIGTFNQGHKKLIYMPVLEGITPLKNLFKSIEKLCIELGFEKDKRKYNPHITLVRNVVFNDRVNTALPMPYLKDAITINSITLYQSHRVHGQLTYTPLYSINLL